MDRKINDVVVSLKNANIEATQWENRLEGMKETHANLVRQKQSLEDEINRKRADFDNYISMKDSEIKKARELLANDQATLASQKEDFKKLLQQHEIDKSNHQQAVKELEVEKNKVNEARARVDGFVIACQRAYSLIG